MICPRCGKNVEDDKSICPNCSQLLRVVSAKDEGYMAMRQGRARQQAGADEEKQQPSLADTRQGTTRITRTVDYIDNSQSAYGEMDVFDPNSDDFFQDYYQSDRFSNSDDDVTRERELRSRRPDRKRHDFTKKHVNMARLTIALAALVVLAVFGFALYLRYTFGGQVILARLGRDATSEATWYVGNEKLDTGDMTAAIEYFEKARALDGDDPESVNVDGVMTLAGAYEAVGDNGKAVELYQLVESIVPNAPEAYKNEIKILLSTGRDAEAAELMKTAYENTGSSTFKRQRNELLPSAPSTSIAGGYYTEEKTVKLTSLQDNQIYYTLDEEAELPDGGTLYTQPIIFQEGTWNVRAVCVDGNLVSDELKVQYKVYLSAPQAPNCNLAPKEYTRRQKVRLRLGEENKGDDTIKIYYTIDGSKPDSDSPIYHEGQEIELPTGKVTLMAVAVNENGKASNIMERSYKISVKPKPLAAFSTEDAVDGMVLYKTTQDEFTGKFGDGSTSEVTVTGFENECTKIQYDWGYAVFSNEKGKRLLIDVCCTSSGMSFPRSTRVGMREDEVTGKFKDMDQLPGESGSRGLYEDSLTEKGKIYVNQDGTKVIRYITTTADSNRWQLDYNLDSLLNVESIHMFFIPR